MKRIFAPLLFGFSLLLAQPAAESLDSWRQTLVTTVAVDLHHVQGIDIAGDVLWVSSVDAKSKKGYLSRIELPSGKLLNQVEVQEGNRIHPGGITLDGASVWIPVAEYDRDGPTTVQRRNAKTLALESSFEVDDHIGCIAAGEDFLIGGNWDSKNLYRWDKKGKEIWKKANPTKTSWQDLKMDGDLLMGSGNSSRETGAVDWLRLSDLSLQRRITTGKTDRNKPFTNEGMTYKRRRLYLLPEDAPSRLFEFRSK